MLTDTVAGRLLIHQAPISSSIARCRHYFRLMRQHQRQRSDIVSRDAMSDRVSASLSQPSNDKFDCRWRANDKRHSRR